MCIGECVEKVRPGAQPGPAMLVGGDCAISLARRLPGFLPGKPGSSVGRLYMEIGGHVTSQVIGIKVAAQELGLEGTPSSKAHVTGSPGSPASWGHVLLCWGHGSGFLDLDTRRLGGCHPGTLSFLPSLGKSENVSHSVVSNSLRPHQAPLSMGFSRLEYWTG